MTRRRTRSLRPDEVALWRQVTENTVPLHLERQSDTETSRPSPDFRRNPDITPAPLPTFRVGSSAPSPRGGSDLAPTIGEALARTPVAMDRKTFTRMKKGRLAPEARIDLHGMTAAQAHAALTRFILRAAAEGCRLALVITGKGRPPGDDDPVPLRHGVLRHQVPHWLHTAPLKPFVLQIAEAHLKHGGQGAYYVYLRRNRA